MALCERRYEFTHSFGTGACDVVDNTVRLSGIKSMPVSSRRNHLVDIIISAEPSIRDQPFEDAIKGWTTKELLEECRALETFRHESKNLYHSVRSLLFLHAIHRYRVADAVDILRVGHIPVEGVRALHNRDFESAIKCFLLGFESAPSEPLSSALAHAYRELAFQTLADQVKLSVRSFEGNTWMFNVKCAADHPLRVKDEVVSEPRPTLVEDTPVRMDLTHSGWSDIFFLGMDYPEGARVMNISVDLALHGTDKEPSPPIETRLRVIDEPLLRLVSHDLGAKVDISSLDSVFDYACDHLGLLRAGVIASGLVPPSLEGSGEKLTSVLARVFGDGRGVLIETKVRGIPKGSRLAVSTNLLASIIAVIMRATGQATAIEGPLEDVTRRLVVARAILGEWLGGSGGGWQDSGGLWPGVKLIQALPSQEGDAEFGVSRGRLVPSHTVLQGDAAPKAALDMLQRGLVLVHGGMAQNCGPILQMVTEKYLLRSEPAWTARQQSLALWDKLKEALGKGDLKAIGALTQQNFFDNLKVIIPWATNDFTETLIERVQKRFGADFYGFNMFGGMCGGGMGFYFNPEIRDMAQDALQEMMVELKREKERSMPFAMDPVVCNFAVNTTGTVARLLRSEACQDEKNGHKNNGHCINNGYVNGHGNGGLEVNGHNGSAVKCSKDDSKKAIAEDALRALLKQQGFDRVAHEEIQADFRAGRIGLSQNRLLAQIHDVREGDVIDTSQYDAEAKLLGEKALQEGSVGIVTLAAGVGTRWTQGAGCVKALHPFCVLNGKHRSFLEIHIAKTRQTARKFGSAPLHFITTSHLTHEPIGDSLKRLDLEDLKVVLSPGRSIGLRMIPMERDLKLFWEAHQSQKLDEQAQKVRMSGQAALLNWARQSGEGSDYTDNLSEQCLHPVGHFYEIPNLLLNGTLAAALQQNPGLKTLLLHNIDTLGADLDPLILGRHLRRGAPLTFEVVTRRIEDTGGGLARVDGRLRLVESLALPTDEDELKLSYYNSATCWINIDELLRIVGLTRDQLSDEDRVAEAVRSLQRRLPTYVTLKDVKKRWGQGHEDIFPVAQFEKLWGDMSSVDGVECAFMAVRRMRGQQLKDVSLLDGWYNDGSKEFVENMCDFSNSSL